MKEVPENAADVAHLNYLHGPNLLNGVDLRYTDSCVNAIVSLILMK